jgi:large subunit ribosomal protein L25
MSVETTPVVATKRETNKKNIHRKAIGMGIIPGVLYNRNHNTPISVSRKDFTKIFQKSHSNTIYTIELDGQKKKAFVKSYSEYLDQTAALSHVDFFDIEPGSKIKIKIPLHFTGLAKGVSQGGILEHMSSFVEVRCKAEDLPEHVEVDVTELGIGDHFNVKDLKPVTGVEFLDPATKSLAGVISTAKRDSELQQMTATAAATAPVEAAADAKPDAKADAAKKDAAAPAKKDAKK